MGKKKWLQLVMILTFVSCLFGCQKVKNEQLEKEIATQQEAMLLEENSESDLAENTAESEEVTEEIFVEKDITLMAIGDNLMHMGIIYTGKMEDGSYDYSFMYDGISDFLEKADIKIVNQETILGGNERGFSGYPYFNSPTELGDAIAEAGFNVVLQATNHSADQGIDGLKNCAAFWKQYPEVLMLGIYENAEENHDIPVLTIDGVTFAVLNYTYGPNMETISQSIQGHLEMLCDWDENTGLIDFTTIHPKVLKDIETASDIADVVIVCPHWGTEYATVPSDYQRKFAEQMTQAGADLVVGTHPHVVQPVEWIESDNGNRALCYYSLGNYVSTQKEGISMLEAMAWVTFTVKEDGIVIAEDNTGVLPMVCHYTGNTRLEDVYLLENYTEEMAARHGIHGYGGVNLTLSELQRWSDEIFNEFVISAEHAIGYE